VEENEMKTMVAFTMVLGTLVLATAADAACSGAVWAGKSRILYVCSGKSGLYDKVLAIVERPQNGTAVIRADGSIYYSPRHGFTGRDTMRVQRAACNFSGTWHSDPLHDWCGHFARTYSIFVE
jgi:hypothetical protein